MDLGIKDRVAVVTGAGRGIGRQICLTLGQEGAKVAVNDVFQERADAVAEEIRRAGGQALGVVADVTDLGAVTAMALSVALIEGGYERFGKCHSSTCDDVYVDISRNRSRRHCSDTCTTRENVAAHRARQREDA